MFKPASVWRLLGTAAISAMSMASGSARADVVNFEPGFVLLSPGDTYTEGLARFTPAGGDALIDPSFCDPLSEFCAVGNNTSYLTGLNDALVTMTTSTDRWFSLSSFDASFFPSPFINFAGSDIKLQLTGTTWGGNAVSQLLQLFEEPGTGNFLFNSYTPSADFGMLRSVTFGVCFQQGPDCVRPSGIFANDAQFSLDNVAFGIPEPSGALLLALGIGLLAATGRRSAR